MGLSVFSAPNQPSVTHHDANHTQKVFGWWNQCSFLQALLTTYMVFIIVLFLIAVLVVNTCREFELLHRAQGATAHKGPLHRS